MASATTTVPRRPRVAYYCMEFGLSTELTTYSGGLGILAGDAMKSAGDLRLPVVGVGLLWNRGYVSQTIDSDGKPVDDYPLTDRSCLAPMLARATVEIDGEDVEIQASKVRYLTRADLYLIEPVDPKHRWITKSLYGGGDKGRVAQEILLGIGGVRMLAAIGHDVDVHHFNEGHAVFAGLELVRRAQDSGLSFDDAVSHVRERIVFTTHTPVPAGNEEHPIAILEERGATCGLTREQLVKLGGDPFAMTVAGLRLSRRANGVAQLHGETARGMWKHVSNAAPIVAITNGVHRHTWQDARIRAALSQSGDSAIRTELKKARAYMRRDLTDFLDDKTSRTVGATIDPSSLVIGFARRAATYKRANLVLGDPDRLRALLGRGAVLVYSGKAHPADDAGKAVLESLISATRDFPGHIMFIEDYRMEIGALLTRGCDVWLNTPRRPKEACGTSGMKAAMNGVLNLSILDGWWPEGYVHGETGWQIAPDYAGATDVAVRDVCDRDEIYRVLESEVLPAFADPDRWTDMMLASIRMSQWQFSSDRMMLDYYDQLYAR